MPTDPTTLTGPELDALVATVVMGWQLPLFHEWSPSTRWDHAGEVWERLKELGFAITLDSAEPTCPSDAMVLRQKDCVILGRQRNESELVALCRAAVLAVRATKQ